MGRHKGGVIYPYKSASGLFLYMMIDESIHHSNNTQSIGRDNILFSQDLSSQIPCLNSWLF